ncbi:hypothetical protein JTE90_007056 [Oedothorax gibbosus]|uniref:SHSP domain-containing protein n=1 Tax=Oedothorax gibbosus TaxID=931172 RepID=A0AAV6U230_9ARAC|nr:hypothetical protein JTE90_007056 [Oedothorax gibbosus]
MFSSLIRDLYDPFDYRYNVVPRLLLEDYTPSHSHPHIHFNVIRPRRQNSTQNEGSDDSNKFQVMLNVKHFSPDEIDVKTVDNCIVIHGRHEEQADEHGFVSREFTRRYQLPDDVEPEKVKSSLSRDGVLTISAPRKALEPPPKNERIVPITIQRPAAVEEAQKQQQQLQEQAAAAANQSGEPMQQ